MKLRIFGLCAFALLAAQTITPAKADDGAMSGPPQFVGLTDGQTVTTPVVVHFQLPGAAMSHHAMAGGAGMHAAGHVHLFIDSGLPKAGEEVPSDEKHRHLMHGEQQTTLSLLPGDHTLQLVMAGANHRVGTPLAASEKITIHVAPKSGGPARHPD